MHCPRSCPRRTNGVRGVQADRREMETMAVRKEWTEWHLTPRGWEKGATRVHGQGNTWVEEPVDRLLSFVYQEVETGASPDVKKWSEETFRSKKSSEVEEALKKYGA